MTCAVLVLTLSGCGSTQARTRDDKAHAEPARRDGKLLLTAEVEGDSLVATLTRQVECRDARPNPRGAVGEPAWRTCGATPVPGESLVIEFADLAGTTGADGRVVFDRGAFMRMLDANSAGAKAFARNLAETHVRLDVPGRADLVASDGNTRVVVDLSTFLPQWEARRIAQQDSDRSQGDSDRKLEDANRAQEDANRRQATAEAKVAQHLASIARCEEDTTAIENALTRLERAKEPWGEEDLLAMGRSIEPLNNLGSRLSAVRAAASSDPTVVRRLEALVRRFAALAPRAAALQPRVERAAARLAAERDRKKADEERRKADAEKAFASKCVDCCLRSRINATRDHCTASCASDVWNHLVDVRGSTNPMLNKMQVMCH